MLAFVDDSKTDGGTADFTLAGYMGSRKTWESFNAAWRFELSRQPSVGFLHMVECDRLQGEFRGVSREKRDLKLFRLVDVIIRHDLLSFDSRLSQKAYKENLDGLTPYELRSPYSALFCAVIATAARLALHCKKPAKIEFTFDDQQGLGREAANSYGILKASLPRRIQNVLGGTPKFRSDVNCPPLQAADMLAWHLRRSRDPRFAGEHRIPLAALRTNSHCETEVTSEHFQALARQFAAIGVQYTIAKDRERRTLFDAITERIDTLPLSRQEQEYRSFNRAVGKIHKPKRLG